MMWKNIVAHCKVRPWAEEQLIRDNVTVQGDRFVCLNTMAVVKLSVNSRALISLYQLYSHNCRFLGKDYQFVQTVICSHVWQT